MALMFLIGSGMIFQCWSCSITVGGVRALLAVGLAKIRSVAIRLYRNDRIVPRLNNTQLENKIERNDCIVLRVGGSCTAGLCYEGKTRPNSIVSVIIVKQLQITHTRLFLYSL